MTSSICDVNNDPSTEENSGTHSELEIFRIRPKLKQIGEEGEREKESEKDGGGERRGEGKKETGSCEVISLGCYQSPLVLGKSLEFALNLGIGKFERQEG